VLDESHPESWSAHTDLATYLSLHLSPTDWYSLAENHRVPQGLCHHTTAWLCARGIPLKP